MAKAGKRWIGCALGALVSSGCLGSVAAQSASGAPNNGHEFDFEFGTWKTHVSLLAHPLTGSKAWAQFDGITVVRKVWGGEANLVELDMRNASRRVKLASFRLYNPTTHQWSLNVVNANSGELGVPTIGAFANGRGVFYDKEDLNGKPIVVRFVIEPRSDDSIHFEQAFSADNGKTWETNWIADDTRIKDRSKA
ncbi:hypothetical protein [Dyella sp. 2HG41-7]|uniref:hypothetical protein n=1 Tax=Dyella sp. 2HG41-7 TaxID=2883239 RepID=UPI001F31E8DA|nr:hypothetical protein [Dyella sp. 2HG41-7]